MKQSPQELAKKSLENGNPTGWFEELYAQSDTSGSGVPWANMKPNPYLITWLEDNQVAGTSRDALVVGCGLGDDAHELSTRGFDVTAFDVSKSAIEICRKRFPDSNITFQQADLFNPPPAWRERFDFVFESLTVQSLPPDYQATAMRQISSFVTSGGQLLMLTWVRSPQTPLSGPPWLLLASDLAIYLDASLSLQYKQQSPTTGHVLALYGKD